VKKQEKDSEQISRYSWSTLLVNFCLQNWPKKAIVLHFLGAIFGNYFLFAKNGLIISWNFLRFLTVDEKSQFQESSHLICQQLLGLLGHLSYLFRDMQSSQNPNAITPIIFHKVHIYGLHFGHFGSPFTTKNSYVTFAPFTPKTK